MTYIDSYYCTKCKKEHWRNSDIGRRHVEFSKPKLKAYDVRFKIHCPTGYKRKILAKNFDEASDIADSEATGIGIDPDITVDYNVVGLWKKRKGLHKKRVKRENNPEFKKETITRIHPKTGKRFKQTVYVRNWKYILRELRK